MADFINLGTLTFNAPEDDRADISHWSLSLNDDMVLRGTLANAAIDRIDHEDAEDTDDIVVQRGELVCEVTDNEVLAFRDILKTYFSAIAISDRLYVNLHTDEAAIDNMVSGKQTGSNEYKALSVQFSPISKINYTFTVE